MVTLNEWTDRTGVCYFLLFLQDRRKISTMAVGFDIAPVDRAVVKCGVNIAPPLAARSHQVAARLPHTAI
jgi:hypothetical protein